MDKLSTISLPSTPRTVGLRPSKVNASNAPRTRVVYSKPVTINHAQVYNKRRVVERIARNTVVIISSFYRCKHPEAKDLFDRYIETILSTQKDSLDHQQGELDTAIQKALSKGYKFDVQGTPATLEVTVSNPHVQAVVDLIVQIDDIVDKLNKLAVIQLISADVVHEHEEYALSRLDYIDKSLSVLLQRLSKEFSFKANKNTSSKTTKNVDFDKIKAFLSELALTAQPVSEPEVDE
jgi:hypothetical protein